MNGMEREKGQSRLAHPHAHATQRIADDNQMANAAYAPCIHVLIIGVEVEVEVDVDVMWYMLCCAVV